MKKLLMLSCVTLFFFGITGMANATLWDRGGGLIYDDVLNITWLQDANYAQVLMEWGDAVAWAAELEYYDYVRDVTWDDWRLPDAHNQDGSGPGDPGYDVTGSEMGHLYYIELGNTSGNFTNSGPFDNVQPMYWSGTEAPPLHGIFPSAWYFWFVNGGHGATVQVMDWTAWAVRDGDVAQNVINFESMTIDILADATYQTATPFYPGVRIETIDNNTGAITGGPAVVRAHINPNDCGLGIPSPGTVAGFNAMVCSTYNDTNNYPVHSGWNSLTDTSEGLPPAAGAPRKQDGYLISFDYPVKDFSLWFADWGDYFPNPDPVETYPSYIKLIAYDGIGNIIVSAEGPKLNAVDSTRDAAKTNGIITLGLTGSNISKVEVRFMGKTDPGVTIDDITFTGDLNVDIKPGSYPNCFNSNEHGVIPVAILGSADFDVTMIDPSTVLLDSQAVRVKGKSGNRGSLKDVNNDGFDDLVVQIIDEGAYSVGNTTGYITAYSYSGIFFKGQDSICITR